MPLVGHLHGTELLMLEAIEDGGASWPHGAAWEQRMRAWAARCARLIVLSDTQVHRAEHLLGIDGARCVQVSNGFDPELFHPREVDRAAHWRRHLVDEPQGWRPGEEAGSVAYDAADLEAFVTGPVLLYVGRFTAVKRVGLLIEAYARARTEFEHRAPLVLVGGYPGEWEGEHPAETIERTGAEDVYLAGWHGHDELPAFLNASDVVVLPSVREQFGQVLVEGMACRLPAIAVDAHGPGEIVERRRDGLAGRAGRSRRARRGAGRGRQPARGAPPPRRSRPRGRARALLLARAGGARWPRSTRPPAAARVGEICTAVHIHRA